MNWDQTKKQYYRADGTYRDLFVEGMDSLAWQQLCACLNEKYPLAFHHRENDVDTQLDRIELPIVERQWALQEYVPWAKINLDGVKVDLFFFAEEELEATLDPRDFRSEARHKALVAFMKELAGLTGRPVRFSQEGNREKVYLEMKPPAREEE